MNVETELVSTFATHEHLAPEPDDVLAAVHARVARPHRPGRPLAVAATVVVLSGGIAGAVAFTRGPATPSTGAPGASVPATPAADPAPDAPVTTRPVVAGPAPLAMPFDVGYLPPGTVEYIARRVNVSALDTSGPPVLDGEYLLTVTTGGRRLDIDVQQMPGGLGTPTFKSGPGAATTVGGRAAIESSVNSGPGGYEVYSLDPAGGLLYVNVANDPATTSAADPGTLATVGRQVAGSVTLPGTTTVTPTFGVGYVPAGLLVRGFDVEPASADGTPATTSYDIGTAAAQDPRISVFTGVSRPAGPTAGRPVQGHPTLYTDDAGYVTLVVTGAAGGSDVCISARLPLDELYRIGDGLVLPG